MRYPPGSQKTRFHAFRNPKRNNLSIAMRRIFRIVTWCGIALAMGPGSSIPNSFDMLFLIGGVLMAAIGALGLITTLEKRRA
jgi:peptidoglycan/LPS O-acetylase OafA/YrhL